MLMIWKPQPQKGGKVESSKETGSGTEEGIGWLIKTAATMKPGQEKTVMYNYSLAKTMAHLLDHTAAPTVGEMNGSSVRFEASHMDGVLTIKCFALEENPE